MSDLLRHYRPRWVLYICWCHTVWNIFKCLFSFWDRIAPSPNWPWTHYGTETPNPWSSRFYLPNARITPVFHQPWPLPCFSTRFSWDAHSCQSTPFSEEAHGEAVCRCSAQEPAAATRHIRKQRQKEFSPKSLTYKGLQATSTDTEKNRDEQSPSEASETTQWYGD